VKAPETQRAYVEPEQLMALLDAADTLRDSAEVRPVLATLAGAGLRIGEACALEWRDVNLATGTLRVRESKTDAGQREVDLPLGLADELRSLKATRESEYADESRRLKPSDPVFLSGRRDGERQRQTDNNVRHRLKTAIEAANPVLQRAGIEPLSERVAPHALRRTYASIRAALRDDPIYIAEQGGWTDPTFVFRVYQRAAKRRERLSGEYLAAFDRALDWARMGTNADWGPVPTGNQIGVKYEESAR
jgi:integrase